MQKIQWTNFYGSITFEKMSMIPQTEPIQMHDWKKCSKKKQRMERVRDKDWE